MQSYWKKKLSETSNKFEYTVYARLMVRKLSGLQIFCTSSSLMTKMGNNMI